MRSLLLALALVPFAQAGDAGDYARLFPLHPCSDGWAGCVVDGDVYDADAARDGAGYPMPADLRFGWFDLSDTVATSPFTGLSDYSAVPVAVAAAPEPRQVRPEAAEPARRDIAANPTANDPAPEVVASTSTRSSGSSSYEPPSTATRATPSRKGGSSYDGAASSGSSGASGSGSSVTEDYGSARSIASYASEPATGTAAELSEPAATPRAASTVDPFAVEEQQATFATQGSDLKPAFEEAVPSAPPIASNPLAVEEAAPVVASVEPVDDEPIDLPVKIDQTPQVFDDSCDDLKPLQPQAVMGRLRAGQIGCLEDAFGAAGSQTDKDAISRVLMVNAEAADDKRSWEKLVKRHLDEVDRSDPEICFSYALHLSKGSVGRAYGVIKWADYALENKTVWTGSTYKARVYALYKLKAEAATRLWEDAAQKVVDGKGDRDALQSDEEQRRGIAKTYALEWLTYARQSGQKTSEPMALCVSAAGNKKFCGE